MTYFLILMTGLMAVSLWLGLCRSRKSQTKQEYFLVGRNLGGIALSATFLATSLGGGTVLGAADEAYRLGWSFCFPWEP